jgi:FAD:protein FMN transferase
MKIGSSKRNRSLTRKINYQIKQICIYLVTLLLFTSCSDTKNLEVYSLSGNTMGTTYSIKIVESRENKTLSAIQLKIDSVLIEVNNQMSTYLKDSEISLFNSSQDTSWFKVSYDFAAVVEDAIKIGHETESIYDITIGPVVNLWGFGSQAIPQMIPSVEEIEKAKQKTGIDKLSVDLESIRLKKTIPELYCDLSSIAKGFGVDKVSFLLENYDYNNFMVEIGGEVRTKGMNQKKNWKIGISTPKSDGLQKVLSISNVSVATSGDYLNYFENKGVRYSHLIDPRNGKPITHNLASVTVVNNDCRTADAYATAINVMGSELGYEFALEKKLAIFMIVREENKFIEKMTPQFEEYILEER